MSLRSFLVTRASAVNSVQTSSGNAGSVSTVRVCSTMSARTLAGILVCCGFLDSGLSANKPNNLCAVSPWHYRTAPAHHVARACAKHTDIHNVVSASSNLSFCAKVRGRESSAFVAQTSCCCVTALVASGAVQVARGRVTAVTCAAQGVFSFIFTVWTQQHSGTSTGPVSSTSSWTVV